MKWFCPNSFCCSCVGTRTFKNESTNWFEFTTLLPDQHAL